MLLLPIDALTSTAAVTSALAAPANPRCAPTAPFPITSSINLLPSYIRAFELHALVTLHFHDACKSRFEVTEAATFALLKSPRVVGLHEYTEVLQEGIAGSGAER